MESKLIVSLCNGSGSWEAPYLRDGGYTVLGVDPKNETGDVRDFKIPDGPVHGILCGVPCTEFAGSGARWWALKPPHLLTDALEIVAACLDIIEECKPAFWALENPVGRLARVMPRLGPWVYTWQPHEYGGYLPETEQRQDAYTKRTCMWGRHRQPIRKPIPPVDGSKLHRLGPSPERASLRSVTPAGFSQAFFEANR